MGKIHILPKKVISKVAAGEVIESPASIVKELIENSIDAKAKRIEIKVEGGGIKKIEVTDNGEGMDEKDILKCFKRYTTSKIKNVEDLFSIKSLGFRGEALFSICSVSKTTIQSRHKSQLHGIKLELQDGKIKNKGYTGMPIGTRLTIEYLFYNIPARKKFLKKEETEYRHVLNVVISNILSFPKISFSLYKGNKMTFNFTKNQSREERIKILFGIETYNNLIPIKYKDEKYKIEGYISNPQSAVFYKNQYIFVNNRHIKNKTIENTIKNSYGTLISFKMYPQIFAFFTLPSEFIDVNVHPQKYEINFLKSEEVETFIKYAVEKTLSNTELTFKYKFKDDTYNFLADKLSSKITPWSVKKELKNDILQIGRLYLITEHENKLLFIDQHAAHEKILYNQFVREYKKQIKNTIRLETPKIIELSYVESEVLETNLKFFKKLGFRIQKFGKATYKVNRAPEIFNGINIENIIKETLNDIKAEKKPNNLNKSSLKTISYLACRTAVKANEYLTSEERKKLVKKVLKDKNTTYTCPHGRPVMVEISLKELDKIFYRH
ncbi:hypothetical protein COV24_00615 [candidate division WWE3 bacterium CG10_big_fil_rev_8_21_14_0_10_32_10]|uniref:DNA mismatch repair protein MutL n=1 Tax=candidate division WWE3 bacterium CG10_big_fil_rev_8_21_14_0_10_32_10 TaxID=1975090 RepID=A0A2H0RBE3_UNCKA|nr:MAG: hypothetical protein COV24_00615 [candidate division WWE3 bacterium CG10_big_fil_rev_8_21_14_0_10_32_10]